MTGDWITEKQSGRTKTREVRPKYELLKSHVARRTFVTMCLRKGMSPEDIRAVTGHTTADMMKYVKFDDESKREKMSILNENAHQELRPSSTTPSLMMSVFSSACLLRKRILKSSREIPLRSTLTSLSSPTSEATSKPVPSTSNAFQPTNSTKYSKSSWTEKYNTDKKPNKVKFTWRYSANCPLMDSPLTPGISNDKFNPTYT